MPYAFYLLLYLAVALIATGWGFLIVAFVRRRRWARDHANLVIPLDIASVSKAP